MEWVSIKDFDPIVWCNDTIKALGLMITVAKAMFSADPNLINNLDYYGIVDNNRRLIGIIEGIKIQMIRKNAINEMVK